MYLGCAIMGMTLPEYLLARAYTRTRTFLFNIYI